jgi:hypothetical protein
VAALALLTVAAYTIVARRSGPVTATLKADATGSETLELACEECADGTSVRSGGASAAFSNARARLALKSPLRVGSNELTLTLSSPASREPDEVTVIVPVHYRLRGDFSGLSGARPQLRVLVEAVKEAAVVVDGRAIALDDAGKGAHAIDVSAELTGAELSVTTLERLVPYTITTPAAGVESGSIQLKIGVVPLQVTAPGDSIVIDTANFILAGQTQASGSVNVAGRAITVDASGRFAQMMSVSAVGETTIEVRASAPSHAPRLFPLHIKRVASLESEATAFARGASQGLPSISANPSLNKGWAVVLSGQIVETRVEHHTSIALLEVKKGCAENPCLVRLRYGAELPHGKGAFVRAFGHVQGSIAGPRPGTQIPEVRVQFFLAGRE